MTTLGDILVALDPLKVPIGLPNGLPGATLDPQRLILGTTFVTSLKVYAIDLFRVAMFITFGIFWCNCGSLFHLFRCQKCSSS